MKYRMRLLLVCGAMALGFFGTSHLLQAQDSSYQAISDKFFDMVQQGKGADAVDYIFGTNPAMKKVPDQVEQVKSQFGSLGTLMGAYVSHTKLAETKVAGMFVYQHYFVAYERQPISVRIQFYKPGRTWLCYGVQFDAQFTNMIQKATDDRIPIDAK